MGELCQREGHISLSILWLICRIPCHIMMWYTAYMSLKKFGQIYGRNIHHRLQDIVTMQLLDFRGSPLWMPDESQMKGSDNRIEVYCCLVLLPKASGGTLWDMESYTRLGPLIHRALYTIILSVHWDLFPIGILWYLGLWA